MAEGGSKDKYDILRKPQIISGKPFKPGSGGRSVRDQNKTS
jgi:hypothetical protein